jgi:glycerol-3-phosphate dehydrogenase
LLTRTAPHLVRAVPFIAPLNNSVSRVHGALTEAGIRAGDAMRIVAGTPASVLPPPRRVSKQEALRLIPALRDADLRGAILFWDGQIEDDARLVIAVARTAAARGVRILTYCEAVDITHGRVSARDAVTGQQFDIATRHVVNATGVWADRLTPQVRLTPSKGAHVILPAHALENPRASLIVPVPHVSARWVGATPTDEARIIVGVTDDPYDGDIVDQPEVAADEEDFLLGVLSSALRSPLHEQCVVGRYAGFRPLLAGKEGSTADLSRRHALITDAETGTLTIVGGKLTTYRRMAQDAVDRLLAHARRPCVTTRLPLVGAAPQSTLNRVDAPRRLVRRYGTEAPFVASLAREDSSLLDPIAPGLPVLGVELLFAVQHEGALTVDDVLERRVRLGLVPTERRAAEEAAATLVHAIAA